MDSNNINECPHCKFIKELADYLIECGDSTNREYWIITEIYTYLHDGKDFCNYNKNKA